jgi:succinate dehydrogenase/fumarate reductase flavoprotein subunit
MKTRSVPIRWDMEADVVCVGYGGAGAVAAIEAHDAGASVLILEKMDRGGGNTAISGGGFLSPNDVNDAITYITSLYRFSHSDIDPELVGLYARESAGNVDYLKRLRKGIKFGLYGHAGYASLPGARSMDKYQIRGAGKGGMGGVRLWELLTHAVEQRRNIPVRLQTPARRLVMNGEGEIVGVIAESSGRELAVRANRAVILTTGGYEYDSKTLQNSVKGFPIYSHGSPGNTGDGVRMAQKAGAALWHMNGVSCSLGLKVPEVEAAFVIHLVTPRHILVDRRGRRFIDEKSIEIHAGLLAVDHFDIHALEYPRIPCFAVFDEKARCEGRLAPSFGYAALAHEWSRDNSVEIEKGWILRGETITALAAKTGIDGSVLEATLSRWNNDVKRGEDTEFHRPMRPPAGEGRPAYKHLERRIWLAPIDTPPYYALPLYPSLANTQGGPRRNTRAQVVDPYGQPIPRLYSAGELGSMWGIIYQGAGNIGECIVIGRIAGRNGAAEKPWSR